MMQITVDLGDRQLRIDTGSTASAAGGKVTLVGGGPGDLGLLTLRAAAAIAEAEVVFHDRLGPQDQLASLAPGAELVDVGKQPGRHVMPQEEIERQMIMRARDGERVVRLKGGDPFVFGRGSEELAACRRVGVPVEVVPGVSSAVAVPAAAEIPVTARGVSHAFTVISAHAPLDDREYEHLVGLGSTIVVLMGVGTLPSTVAGLLSHGMSPSTPMAIIERGFSPSQRVLRSTLGSIADELKEFAPASPAVIVVGEVVDAISDDIALTTPELAQSAAGLPVSCDTGGQGRLVPELQERSALGQTLHTVGHFVSPS